MDLIGAAARDDALGPEEVRQFLSDNPDFLHADKALLAELGLKPDASNVVEFGHAALARVNEAHKRESHARKSLEATARANFAAQAQTHGAVVDLLDARNHSDLARRVDELAQLRFGLHAGVVALEGPDRIPAGWRVMPQGGIATLLNGWWQTAELAGAIADVDCALVFADAPRAQRLERSEERRVGKECW